LRVADGTQGEGAISGMTGATVAIGILAFVMTTLATLSNMVIAREFPAHDPRRDLYLPLDQSMRVAQYRQAAKLFYFESLSLWGLFVVMVIVKLLFDL
jgi:heme O synthase-like polyprenyltransferase